MSKIGSSTYNLLKKINPYAPRFGGLKSFVSDARKEGIIKPVLYGFIIGSGVFEVSSGLGKKLVRRPMKKWVVKPLARIMGLEAPKKNTFRDKVIDALEAPEVTFGLSSGAGAGLTISALYGAHKLLQKAFAPAKSEKDEQKS